MGQELHVSPALKFVVNSIRSHMALSLIGTYALITHFGYGRRARQHRSFWGAFGTALQSRTMYGTLITSATFALFLKRTFNLPIWRVFVAFFCMVWSLIYRWRVVENPVVSFRRTYWNTTLVEKAKITETPFQPVIWGFNRHAQTISLYALSNLEWFWAEPIRYSREQIPAFDYPNTLFLDWAKQGDAAKHKISHEQGNDAPVVLFVHGLGDDREIPYMKRCIRLCLQKGYRTAVFSYWRYDFEESRDLGTIIDRIQTKYPTAPIACVAWSAGVYPLVRYLEKAGASTPVVVAVCQSGCLDFPQAVSDVFSSENPTYGVFLAHQGRICVKRHLDNDKTLSDEQIVAVKLALKEESDPLRLYK